MLSIDYYPWLVADNISAYCRIAADGGANRLWDARKDPSINDILNVNVSHRMPPAVIMGEWSLRNILTI